VRADQLRDAVPVVRRRGAGPVQDRGQAGEREERIWDPGLVPEPGGAREATEADTKDREARVEGILGGQHEWRQRLFA